jgi:hypothetical protein
MDTQTLMNQIGTGNLMRVGARDFLVDAKARSLTMAVGSKRGELRKLIVTHDLGSDTYTVRYFAMRKKGYEIIADESVSGVDVTKIGPTVREMGDRA